MKNVIKFIVNNIAKICFCIFGGLYSLSGYVFFTTDVRPTEVREITVVEKYDGTTNSGKHSYLKFILITRDQNGNINDINVTPATYYKLKIGDKASFDFDVEISLLRILIHLFFIFSTAILMIIAGYYLIFKFPIVWEYIKYRVNN